MQVQVGVGDRLIIRIKPSENPFFRIDTLVLARWRLRAVLSESLGERLYWKLFQELWGRCPEKKS